MNKSKIITAILLITSLITMTACGGSSSGPQESAAGTEAGAAAETEAGADADAAAAAEEAAAENADGIVLPEGFDEGLVYQKNDVTIRQTAYVKDDRLEVLTFDITNDGSSTRTLKMLPLLINGEVTADGSYIELAPSETQEVDFFIDGDNLAFAGLKEIKTIDAYIQLEEENGDPVSEPEIIRLVQNDAGKSEPVLQHSAEVTYDEGGITISYLGSFISRSEENRAVYLISNDTEKDLTVNSDYDFSLVDGTAGGGRRVICLGVHVPSGKKALLILDVYNEEDYTPASFETADTLLLIHEEGQYADTLAQIPVHLTMDGDAILSSADDSYYNDYYSTDFVVYEMDAPNGFKEFQIFFYVKGTGELLGVMDELKIPKSTGATKEVIESLSLDDVFPGLSELDFMEKVVEEDDEYFSYIMIFRNLDNLINLSYLSETGFIQVDSDSLYDIVTVDIVRGPVEAMGFELVDPENYGEAGLHTDLF